MAVDLLTEQRIEAGARDLAMRFSLVPDMTSHFALVDQPEVLRQILWLRKHRKDLYKAELAPAIKGSGKRNGWK